MSKTHHNRFFSLTCIFPCKDRIKDFTVRGAPEEIQKLHAVSRNSNNNKSIRYTSKSNYYIKKTVRCRSY